MEVYYTYPVHERAGALCAWSKAPKHPPLLGISLPNNAVGLYTESGRPVDASNESTIRNIRGTEAAKLAWHPYLPLLVVAWKDGALSFCNATSRRLEEDSKVHRSAVTCLAWSALGDFLLSADDKGKVAIWKADAEMRPVLVASTEQPKMTISHAIFADSGVSSSSSNSGSAESDKGSARCQVFFAATADQATAIKVVDEAGRCTAVQDLPEELHSLVYYPERAQLLAITAAAGVLVLGKSEDGRGWEVALRMKLPAGAAGGTAGLKVVWAGRHTLASASDKERLVRLFDFDSEDNYVLNTDTEAGASSTVAALAYDARLGLLAAGTADGRVVVYQQRRSSGSRSSAGGAAAELAADPASRWQAEPSFWVGGRPEMLQWGPSSRLMASQGAAGVGICCRTLLKCRAADNVLAIQVAPDRVMLESLASQPLPPGRLSLGMQVQSLDIADGMLLAHDGGEAKLYSLEQGQQQLSAKAAGSFTCECLAMALLKADAIVRTGDMRLELCNAAGNVRQAIQLDAAHGQPVLLDSCGDVLAAATAGGYVRMYKLVGRELKQNCGPGLLLPDAEAAELQVQLLRTNPAGTMVAALASSRKDHRRDPRLFVFCTSAGGTLHVYDFSTDGRCPLSLAWDLADPRMLVVQTKPSNQWRASCSTADHTVTADCLAAASDSSSSCAGSDPAMQAALMFATPEHGLMLQGQQGLERQGLMALLGSAAPQLLLHCRQLVSAPGSPPYTSHVTKAAMQGYVGLEDVDEATRRALLDFSYQLAVGSLEEAFRAVRGVRNMAVWRSMAHLSIRNKRLDIAEHCLGNMEHARGARALREGRALDQADARVAAVAVHLGMAEEAAKLYAGCGRQDLLNDLHKAGNKWDQALSLAGSSDRIHLRTTHHAYAQHLELLGDWQAAIQQYEKSGTHVQEVPRMLSEAGQWELLERYVGGSSEPELLQWWGRYCESRGDLEGAVSSYKRAGNLLALVRVLVASGDSASAEAAISSSGDAAAAFHLARTYEAQQRPLDAIRLYSLAGRPAHGARLARQQELDQELLALALRSPAQVQLEAADYLADKGEFEKAAQLYQKAGRLRRAVDMCFECRLYDVLQQIADSLEPGSDPGLVARCADFFAENGQHDKAAAMLVAAKRWQQALDTILAHNVQITEELADALTPSKEELPGEQRTELLLRLGQACKHQGHFHLACKKYTQAGDKLRAMKALVKSGDTEKIVFFAGVSRQREVYLMAANYLQRLDWHASPEVMKHIVSFYSKAGAHDALAAFYEACAQIEIDEYRDYDKAAQALREALKQLGRTQSLDKEQRLASVTTRAAAVDKFSRARGLITAEPQAALALCDQILMDLPSAGGGGGSQPEVELGVRAGDVYALMTEFWAAREEPSKAHALMQQMKLRGIPLAPYLDQGLMVAVCRSLGLDPAVELAEGGGLGPGGGHGGLGQFGSGGMGGDDDEAFIEEAVEDGEDGFE